MTGKPEFMVEDRTSNRPKADLVSVLVPVYNHQEFIAHSLDSVLKDSYPNKEILIVDDGSTDSSRQAVDRWIQSKGKEFKGRITFESRENRGVTKTLNELVAMAKGKYVTILASDDYLLPDGIGKRVRFLENNPEKHAVFADCIVVDREGKILHSSGIEELWCGRKRFLNDNVLMPYELIFHWCVPGPVFMATRQVYELIGGYDEQLLIEDWDFYLRLLSRNYLGFLDNTVSAYRVHTANSYSDTKSEKRKKLLISMIKGGRNNIKGFRGLKRLRIHLKNLSYWITVKEIDETIREDSVFRRLSVKAVRVLEVAYEKKANRILENVR